LLKPDLVLCLGNEILADDALGYHVAARLQQEHRVTSRVEVVFAARAGFALLDLLTGRRRVLIVDSICLGSRPGTVHTFPMRTDAPGRNLTCSHQLSLPAALALGTTLGYDLPGHIDILAVEAGDIQTLGGAMTPAVEASIPVVLSLIINWSVGLPLPRGQRIFRRSGQLHGVGELSRTVSS
jgi:hydrogenase maturation protease